MGLNFSNQIIGMSDLVRLIREVQSVSEYVLHYEITRRKLTRMRVSDGLSKFVEDNNVDLNNHLQLDAIKLELDKIRQTAPVVHISFAVDPPIGVLLKIVDWFRQNIDEYCLLQIGLQPNIALGCVVRTNSKIFDFSLSKSLQMNKASISKILENYE